MNNLKSFNQRQLASTIQYIAEKKQKEVDELKSFSADISKIPIESFGGSQIQENVTNILLKSLSVSSTISHIESAIRLAGRLAEKD